MTARGVETVTRLRPSGAAGRHGAPGPRVRFDISGCHMIPRTSSEDTDRQNTVIVGYTLVAPGGTDLQPSDQIEWRGDTYEVVGLPAAYEKGGRAKAVIAALRRVTG